MTKSEKMWEVRAAKGDMRIRFRLPGDVKADVEKELEYTLNRSWRVLDVTEVASGSQDAVELEAARLQGENERIRGEWREEVRLLNDRVAELFSEATSSKMEVERLKSRSWWRRIFS